MKILVICQYFYPETFQINDICEELSKRNHDITVMTGLPNYPDGKIDFKYRFFKNRFTLYKGVSIRRGFEISRGNDNKLRLCLNYISFSIASSIRALFYSNEYDIILVYQLSPVLMALPGIILKYRYKIPLVLYCCDLWPFSVMNFIKNENSLLFKSVKKISDFIYKKADFIIAQSNYFKEYFINDLSLNPNQIKCIPHFSKSHESLKNCFDKSGLETIHFGFFGNIGYVQNVELIIKAVMLIRNKKFKVHFFGIGSFLEKAKIMVKNFELEDHFCFHGRKSKESLSQYYNQMNICLLTLKNDNRIGCTIPSKFQEYLSFGKPILASIDGEAFDIINKNKCGIAVKANDVTGFSKKMKMIIDGVYDLEEMSRNSILVFQRNYKMDSCINELEKILISLKEDN